ncbi:methionyl-tRNA formyltransferase [Urechidicola croceus]|uniref:Methionyl-tRNA formyltransferase n=2 Tax=Urechidicola croceus TaxID=1850246 RepID=A0A1D8P4M5_9FLAO|nr:methionyl-tRNA formyltransferase [Urechidicola croceus]
MGTPEFAVTILKGLLDKKLNVVGVITAPDRPAGRGRKLNQSAVKKFALEHNLKVLQPTNLKNEEFIDELQSLNANLQIVVAFRMLPRVVWKMPKYGTFNLHASLLPQYRGAAPINWAIINGESKTGVTTFFIDDKIDTGEIILQSETTIEPNETLGELHDKLMIQGSKLVNKTVDLILHDTISTYKQPDKEEKSAPKIHTETCKVNWNDSLDNIYNKIRGLNPFPGAWTTLVNGKDEIITKIYDVQKLEISHFHNIGDIITSKKEIKVAVNEGYLIIDSLKLSGKRKMDAKSLLNGYSIEPNAKML